MRLSAGGRRVAGRVLPRGGGFGGLDQLGGQVVVGVGGLKSPLAGGAGLVGAVGAGGGSVALVFGGVVQGGQQGLDLVGRDDDGPGRCGWSAVMCFSLPGGVVRAGGCRGRCRCRWRVSSRWRGGSRGCRVRRRRGRRRRTSCRRWPGGGRRWRRRARSGCVRGRACPTRRRTGRLTASRRLALTVGASPRTMARMVISRTPRARAMRAEPWPMTCRARSRSRVPPASRRARRRVALVTWDRALVGGGGGLAAAGGQVVDGGGGEAGGGGDGPVGAAVARSRRIWSRTSPGTAPGSLASGGGLAGGGTGAGGHVSWLLRPGGLGRWGRRGGCGGRS